MVFLHKPFTNAHSMVHPLKTCTRFANYLITHYFNGKVAKDYMSVAEEFGHDEEEEEYVEEEEEDDDDYDDIDSKYEWKQYIYS